MVRRPCTEEEKKLKRQQSKAMWAARTPEQRAELAAKQATRKQAVLDAMTPEEREARRLAKIEVCRQMRERRMALSPERQAEMRRKIADAARAQHANMTADERAVASAKRAAGIKASWDVLDEDARAIRVSKAVNGMHAPGVSERHSESTKIACANAFRRSGVRYDAQVTFRLGRVRYCADFVLPDLNLVVEVKGHPRAWTRWADKTRPAILEHGHPDLRFTVLDRCPAPDARMDDVLAVLEDVRLTPARQGVTKVTGTAAKPQV